MAGDRQLHVRSGYVAAKQVLSANPRPSAIFAANDEMAAAVLHAALEQGLEVPRELSILGFDDTPIGAHIWPSAQHGAVADPGDGALGCVQIDPAGQGRRTQVLLPFRTGRARFNRPVQRLISHRSLSFEGLFASY
jgi:ABC-type sugar transport system substrate-binding protein